MMEWKLYWQLTGWLLLVVILVAAYLDTKP